MAKQKVNTNNFKVTTVVDDSTELYTDTIDVKNKVGGSANYGATMGSVSTQAEILTLLQSADTGANRSRLIKISRLLYANNPTYARIVNYYATTYYPRYYITPRFIEGRTPKELKNKAWKEVYNSMIEYADGLNLDVKLIELLKTIFIEGGVYFTTFYSEETKTVDTIILPGEYAARVGETEFGTDVIQFNMSYFDTLGLTDEELKELLEGFPAEFAEYYSAYKADSKKKLAILNPAHSSCVLLNTKAIPTLLYTLVGIRNYEGYTQNELDKSTQALQTIIEHHIPTYQDKLLLEVPEMNLLHKKLSSITKSAKNTRLITTIGDIHVHQLLEDAGNVADNTLENAYKSIYDAAGVNSGLFYGDNQYAVESSLSIDRGLVWHLIEKLANFYNIALNNLGVDFKGYQVELTMVAVSRDKASTDIEQYRETAKLGVGILPFIIASGVRQKNVDSYLNMEANLGLVERLVPLRSSNTMGSEFGDEKTSSSESKPAAESGAKADEEKENGKD